MFLFCFTVDTLYSRVCSKYEDFLFRTFILVSNLLKQEYSSRKLQNTFRQFYGCHTDIVHKFDTSVSHARQEMLTFSGIPDFTPFGSS